MERDMKLPIGPCDFPEMIKYRDKYGMPYTLVDKSLLINAFIESEAQVSLVTRPRRFGKTLNLSMLECFFAPQVHDIQTAPLFEGLQITQDAEAMEYQGQYQAIFITLKTAGGDTYELFYNRIQSMIARLFEQHEDYIYSFDIKEMDHQRYQRILREEASQAAYEESLHLLSALLYKASGKKVYIFVDEYDHPIHDAYLHGYYKPCAQFMASFLNNAFKGNAYLAKGMITGILKVAKASLFSDLNTISSYSMLADNTYAAYFGFTETETDDLLERSGLPIAARKLKEMYNGYQVNDITLYNPWSVVNFISQAVKKAPDRIHEAIQPYWVNTGGADLLVDLLDNNLTAVQDDINKLLQGGSITTVIDAEVHFSTNMYRSPTAFWSIMLLAGYLKSTATIDDSDFFARHTLSLPNQEIRRDFKRIAVEVSACGRDSATHLVHACQQLLKADVTTFCTYLQTYLTHTPSYLDGRGRNAEQFFHGLILGMTACLTRTHHIRSNRESGHGRYDIEIRPRDPAQLGIIIEIKAVNQARADTDLSQLAQQALDQIQTRAYCTDIQASNIPKILMLGMAFDQKQVKIMHKTIAY